MNATFDQLTARIGACQICSDRFAATATAHRPRPVVWLSCGARILIAGQAPGARVHDSGKPFTDASGDRLRDWMGLGEAEFYNRKNVAILPMAFCFPGYNASGSDLPPPSICAKTWHRQVIGHMPNVPLTLLVGGYAQKWHIPGAGTVTDTVRDWKSHAPAVIPLPHPSWRNTGWLKKHPWFESDLLPVLREQVRKALLK
jgi:uracil-DNA glycosylase